ncbi:MAG: c-type cytochrome [Pseudooceanicola atlanticus]
MTHKLTLAAALMALAAPAFADSHAMGDAEAGEKDFRKCKSCHTIASADETIVKGGKTGPNLYGIVGRTAGTVEDFRYGNDLVAAGEAGLVWDEASLTEYVQDPKAFLQEYLDDGSAKSKMSFKHRSDPEDVIAYLATFSEE